MWNTLEFSKLEKLIARDQKLLFTLTSYILILVIYINLNALEYSAVGVLASIMYFLINGTFLGHAFFEKEDPVFRLMFGILLLIMLLGFVGWLAVLIYNLDVLRFTLVLFIVATLSSLINRRVKNRYVT